MQSTKKKNREDIKEIANNSREMFEYLLHVCNVLIDPASHDVKEREVNGLKRDLINTLQKLDSNNSKLMGRLSFEEVKDEAFNATFKQDQYYDYNAYIKNNAN